MTTLTFSFGADSCVYHSLFPHGICYTILAQIMAIGGLVMCQYVLTSCFIQQIKERNPVNGRLIDNSERGYGFFSREADYGVTPDYQNCIYYPDEERDYVFDAWMNTGMVFAFLSGILGLICFVILIFACCVAFTPVMFERWVMWLYIFASFAMALTFMVFGSEWCQENRCKLGQGGGYVISAFFFWLCAANSVKSMARPLPRPNDDETGKSNRSPYEYDMAEADGDLWYDNVEDMYDPQVKGRTRPDHEYEEDDYEEDDYYYEDRDGNQYASEQDFYNRPQQERRYLDAPTGGRDGLYRDEPEEYMGDPNMPEQRLPRVGEDRDARIT